MLEQIDLDVKLDKEEYRRRLPQLQERLYDVAEALHEARIPVLLVFEGWSGTEKIGTIGLLTRRLDPRGLRVQSTRPPRTFETQYPWLYRFWLKTPSYGELTFFDRSWYRQMLFERAHGAVSDTAWRERCTDIVSFEQQLAADGAVILKFWLHISRKEQRRRFKKLLADPIAAGHVTDEGRWQQRHYRRYGTIVDDLIARTDMPAARWQIVPIDNRRYGRIAVFEAVLAALESRRAAAFGADGRASAGFVPPDAATSSMGHVNGVPSTILRRVDLTQTIDQATYDGELARLQAQMHLLAFRAYTSQRPVVLVFEGWDAAGKGGAIKRLTERIDPRGYIVHTIAAPHGEDREHHYLYRFWRRLPPRGQIAIFDRSWYGRVLVERVEGFARPDAWQRAYAEINEFERQLVEFGTVVCKFWLHISPEEQLRRFEERSGVRYKRSKLTDEDWRNRDKWQHYEGAADEMLLRTSTPVAPWTIVEAEDKRFARIKIMRTVVRRLEDVLGRVKL